MLAQITGRTPAFCGDPGLRLAADLGLDRLSLLELVAALEAQLGVTVPDEDTGQVQTVGDLLAVLVRVASAGTGTAEDEHP